MKLFEEILKEGCPKCGANRPRVRHNSNNRSQKEKMVWVCEECGYTTESYTKDHKASADSAEIADSIYPCLKATHDGHMVWFTAPGCGYEVTDDEGRAATPPLLYIEGWIEENFNLCADTVRVK